MLNKKILFVSHRKTQCGVYEFGKNIINVLKNSKQYEFIKIECSSLKSLHKAIEKNKPNAIIYNYHPLTMPWITTKILSKLYKNNISSIKIPQIGIIHEITQNISDTATTYKNKYLFDNDYKLINSLFDFYIAPDPTLLLKNHSVYKTGRLVSSYQNNFLPPLIPTVGSFGFAMPRKNFEKIVQLVQREFDEAIIKFNIPVADFIDKNSANTENIEEKCKKLITKPKIKLIITHDFLNTENILNFLAQNTLNVFLYENDTESGISSAIDMAISAKRPIAISKSSMFRHIFNTSPSICIENCDLKTIIKNGFVPLQKYYNEWNANNLLWDYERILNSILSKKENPIKFKKNIIKLLQSKIRKLLSLPNSTFTWLEDSKKINNDNMEINTSINYTSIKLPQNNSFNRILDNKARKLYAQAINKLIELVPKTMAKKIPEANIQQAFVFDTIYRHSSKYKNPKILCIGSYEDTASMSLIKMGFEIEEIDPMLNYSLQEYITKPSTIKNSYDIIFSTSVIEHDPNDKSFMKAISDLLAPNGIAIITCDYKEDWKPNDIKPEVDIRLYTKNDLKNRLLSYMDNCLLIDEPQWDCSNPDFNYLKKYQYTFATFVIKKIK